MKNKGFTLVELLVAITIVSILIVVGVVVFVKVGQSARDVKKKGDIDAMSKAYESKYLASGTYQPLQGSDFASGEIPVPLEGGSYQGVITANSATYRVCAALEGNDAPSCDTPSATCYCRESQMEKYVASGGGGVGSSYEVTQFAGAAVENTCGSPNNTSQHWTNLTNATSVDNGTYAYHGVTYFDPPSTNIGHISYCLDTASFGFNIPSDATIAGIKVEIMKKNRYASLGYTVYDDIISIIKGGVAGVDNKAKAGNWPATPFYDAYGGPIDLWGETWTPASINASNFGVRLRVKTDALHGAMDIADVDAIKATVYYTN